MNKNSLRYYIFIALISFSFLVYNFYFDQGYWYDEWATLLSSDPSVPINEIFLRMSGIYEGKYSPGSEENVPAYYYLLLRFFFSLFGFTTENGRLFSIIFFILTVLIFCILSKDILGNKNHFFSIIILSLNPLLLWMANETRADTFVLFFSTLNLYFFFKSIENFKKKYFIFLALSNFIMLSVYPLTLSIFFSQIFFLFYKKFILKNISKKIFISYILIFILTFILYFILNYKYLFVKLGIREHYATLHMQFFFGFFFNVFFGNKYFGAIYLLLSVILCIKNIKIFFKNETILFLSIIIISTYSMVIISSLYLTPIASPRYIIFIIPIFILWLIKNILFIEKIIKNKIIIFSLIIFPIINILFTNHDRPVKKPPIKEALNIIRDNDTKNIYVTDYKYYYLYISRIGDVAKNKYKLINKSDIDSSNIEKFTHLCLNNPRFKVGNLILPDEENCHIRFNNYKLENIVKIDDFIITFFQIK